MTIFSFSVVSDDPIRCLTMMDEQFQKWYFHILIFVFLQLFIYTFRQKISFSCYQNQAALFNRLKNEMIGLYAKVNICFLIFMS